MTEKRQGFSQRSKTNHDVTMEALSGLTQRFQDFMLSVDRRDEHIYKSIDGIANEFKALNGKVSKTIEEVNSLKQEQTDLHNKHKACPVNLLQEDVAMLQSQVSVWVFLTKHWKVALVSLAFFAGILIATYSAVYNMLEKVQGDRIERIIDAFEDQDINARI